jgi:hypothetical protein
LYNDRRKEGKISTEVEDQAIEKVQQAAANRLKKTAIPPAEAKALQTSTCVRWRAGTPMT